MINLADETEEVVACKRKNKRRAYLFLLVLTVICAFTVVKCAKEVDAQTQPNWNTGTVPTAVTWNALWASKQDYSGDGSYLRATGGALTNTLATWMSYLSGTSVPSRLNFGNGLTVANNIVVTQGATISGGETFTGGVTADTLSVPAITATTITPLGSLTVTGAATTSGLLTTNGGAALTGTTTVTGAVVVTTAVVAVNSNVTARWTIINTNGALTLTFPAAASSTSYEYFFLNRINTTLSNITWASSGGTVYWYYDPGGGSPSWNSGTGSLTYWSMARCFSNGTNWYCSYSNS